MGLVAILMLISTAITLHLQRPLSDQELFEVRCSTCHPLQREKICAISANLRPNVVKMMRRVHGADQEINQQEADRIGLYLQERVICP